MTRKLGVIRNRCWTSARPSCLCSELRHCRRAGQGRKVAGVGRVAERTGNSWSEMAARSWFTHRVPSSPLGVPGTIQFQLFSAGCQTEPHSPLLQHFFKRMVGTGSKVLQMVERLRVLLYPSIFPIPIPKQSHQHCMSRLDKLTTEKNKLGLPPQLT